MPRKLRVPKQHRQVLRMADLGIPEMLGLISGVSDEEMSRFGFGRWRTWEAYDADYAAVRDELLASDLGRRAVALHPLFAEERYQQATSG